MKKHIRDITFLIIGMLISGVVVYATLTYQANQITYTKSNNQTVTLDTALDELYTSANNYQLKTTDLTVTNAWSAGIRLSPRTKTIELNPGQYLVFATCSHTTPSATVLEANNLSTNAPVLSGDNGNCVSIDRIRQQAPATSPILNDNKYLVSYIYQQIYLCNIDSKKTLTFTGQTINVEASGHTSSVSVQAVKIK